LAARVLNTWHEDFVDEDTGEVVSIERNEIILDRDTIIDKDNVEEIIDSNVKSILLHKMLIKLIMPSFIIRYKRSNKL
jgi:DNA-directed RNA polymerase subunit beta